MLHLPLLAVLLPHPVLLALPLDVLRRHPVEHPHPEVRLLDVLLPLLLPEPHLLQHPHPRLHLLPHQEPHPLADLKYSYTI